MKNNRIWNMISFLIGALVLSLFSLIQKYILFNEIIANIKGYAVPILCGGLSGLVINHLFMKKNRLIDNIKNNNLDLIFQKDEIESLYGQLEAYSQTIDQVNRELEITLKKYETLLELSVNISKIKSLLNNLWIKGKRLKMERYANMIRIYYVEINLMLGDFNHG